MIDSPPPLPQKSPAPTPIVSTRTVVLTIVVVGILIIGGGYFSWKATTKKITQALNVRTQAQAGEMPPDFRNLLAAVESVADEPVVGIPVGKVDGRGSKYFTKQAEAFYEQGELAKLNGFLSSLYADKLMTKGGHFIYRSALIRLAEMQNLENWVESTGGSHAHIAAGYADKDRAWDARGSGYSHTVSEEGWKGFDRYLKKASAHYAKATESDPQNSVALGLLMRIGLGRGLNGVVPEVIEAGIEHTPEDSHLATITLYYFTPRWHGSADEMITFIREDLPKWPDSAGKFSCLLSAIDWGAKWGDSHYLSSNPETMVVYEKILAKYAKCWPEGISATEELGNHLVDSKNYDQAIMFCQKRIETLPGKGNLYAIMGRAEYGKKDFATARSILLQASKLGTDDGLGYYYVARSAISNNDYETGEMAALKAAELLRASSQRKKKAFAYTFAARCASAKHEYKNALEYSDEAIKTDPQQAYVWYSRGHLRHKRQDLKGAKADFLKTLELNPADKFKINQDFPDWRNW